jgi:multiple sugar transport system substrate-binding protein
MFITGMHRIASGLASFSLLLAFGAPGAHAWSLEEAAAPYKGSTIRIICDGYAPCLAYKEMAKKFTERTGIEIAIEVAGQQELMQQALTDALSRTGIYDAIQVQTFSIGVWGDKQFATPMKTFMDNPVLRDPNFTLEPMIGQVLDMTSMYKGELIGIPFELVPGFGIYRMDIAANPDEQKNFKAKYGYDLPLNGDKLVTLDTWEQWRDIAEFFTRKPGDTLAGKTVESPLYGVSAAFKRHITAGYDYERILLGMGGEIMTENNEMRLDTPEAKKALDYFLAWREFAPPSYKEYTWDEQYSDFCAGSLFSTFTWGDTTPFLEDAAGCPAVAGKIGYFAHPGTHKTPAEGHAWVVPTSSKNPEATYLFVQYVSSQDIQTECQAIGCITFDTRVIDLPKWDNDGRVLVLRQILKNDWLYVRPHPPEMQSVLDVLIEELSAAGAGNQTADETLAKITERSKALFAQ